MGYRDSVAGAATPNGPVAREQETPMTAIASTPRFSWIVGGNRRVEIITMGGVSIVEIADKSYAVVRDETREFLGCCPTLNRASVFMDRVLKGGR
jgi:hypothetical protein